MAEILKKDSYRPGQYVPGFASRILQSAITLGLAVPGTESANGKGNQKLPHPVRNFVLKRKVKGNGSQ
jgi:hypothetical protein